MAQILSQDTTNGAFWNCLEGQKVWWQGQIYRQLQVSTVDKHFIRWKSKMLLFTCSNFFCHIPCSSRNVFLGLEREFCEMANFKESVGERGRIGGQPGSSELTESCFHLIVWTGHSFTSATCRCSDKQETNRNLSWWNRVSVDPMWCKQRDALKRATDYEF